MQEYRTRFVLLVILFQTLVNGIAKKGQKKDGDVSNSGVLLFSLFLKLLHIGHIQFFTENLRELRAGINLSRVPPFK
ncbi:hypothetical protein BT93_E1710 [Corymbia citriodora subsp. variegata]|nr:hypothetical protein BT93_E1710 [Corymbia citriodora subsp. variegata]